MFLTVASGRRFFFFCGDVVWNAAAIAQAKPKPLIARAIADEHAEQTLRSVQLLREIAAHDPELAIVPAHDAAVHDRLGYFPAYVT